MEPDQSSLKMNFKIKVSIVIICVIFLIITMLALSSNFVPRQEAEFSYSIVGCENRTENREFPRTYGEVEVFLQDDMVVINQNLSYVCCAKIRLEWSKDGDLINITEINEGNICRCICNYGVNAILGPLPSGKYTISVYGIMYQNIEPDLLIQKEIVVL